MRLSFISIILIVLFNGCSTVQPATQQQLAQLKCKPIVNNYKEQIKDYFSSGLIDPRSAQYDFSTPTKTIHEDECVWYVEVYLNAKNRLGGYTGREKFNFVVNDKSIERINNGFTDSFLKGLLTPQ